MERTARHARDDVQVFLRRIVVQVLCRCTHQVDDVHHHARVRLIVGFRRPFDEHVRGRTGVEHVDVLDADELVEVRLAADRVVRLRDPEAHVEVECIRRSGVVDARVDPVDDLLYRIFDLIVRRRAAAEIEAVLRRVHPDVGAHPRNEIAVDGVAARDEDVVVGDRRRVVHLNVEVAAARAGQHGERDPGSRKRDDVAAC